MPLSLTNGKSSTTTRLVQRVLFFGLLAPLTAAGQRYHTVQLRAKADSILLSHVGKAVFAHARYDSLSYYEFRTLLGHKKYATFSHRRTRGRFSGGEVRYHVLIPYPKCPAFDTIKGWTGVRFDHQLRVVRAPYTAFLPDFYRKEEACQLLSAAQALAIAHQLRLKPGIKPLTADLAYEGETKTFTWSVLNYLTELRDYEDKPTGSVEEILIDAVTGAVKAQRINWYGVLR